MPSLPVTDAKRMPLPRIKRNALSFLTLSWITPLLKRGYRNPLQEEIILVLQLHAQYGRHLPANLPASATDGLWTTNPYVLVVVIFLLQVMNALMESTSQ
eukprot:jgi/Hompol1/1640/HPOL_005672-RA